MAEEVLGIMESVNEGTWFDGDCQAATEDKAYRKMKQGYGTRSLIEEYKEKRRKEKTIHSRKKKIMDDRGIRKYGIAKEKNMNAENFTRKLTWLECQELVYVGMRMDH